MPAEALKREVAATPTPEPVLLNGYGRVQEGGSRLLATPEENAFIRCQLQKGDVVELKELLTDEQGQWWIYVSYDTGMLGYVRAETVQEMTPGEVRQYLADLEAASGSGNTGASSAASVQASQNQSAQVQGNGAVRVGDIIRFGRYEQDNNTANGMDPIEWLVLEVQGNKALVISRFGLESRPYNREYASITWEDCSLRYWLNNTFLRTAFNSEERKAILTMTTDNSGAAGNSSYASYGGNSTSDNVFLLSYAEANKYFASDSDRICQLTARAKARAALTGSNGACHWWLRSPGEYQNRASYVSPYGSLESGSVIITENFVRPVIWLDTDSGIL